MDYRKELLENILPFWLDHAIDYQNGGIYTQLDEKGEIYGTDKSVWFQGRALWTFAKAYNLIEKNPEFLKAAQAIYSFLPKCTDKDGRMFFTVTEDGRELQKRRYYFSETFAAIGCAEYYKATGNEEVWLAAEKYFDVAYECYTGVRKNPPKINPENLSSKALSPIMIMLSTAQTMRSASNENKEKYQSIVDACLDAILNGGFLTERGLLESVSADGKFVDSPNGRIINPGHSLEAAWFILLEGVLADNEKAIEVGKKIIDITLPLGWDKKHGGIIAFCDVSGNPPVQLEWDMKLWWPQCEAMIALRLAYLLFEDETYLRKYQQLEAYCREHFVDDENGEWYGYLHYDNTVSTTLKGNIFKGPFHVPRLYMIMAVLDADGRIERYAD
jgi:N-acylglucosamine 2-epimerase